MYKIKWYIGLVVVILVLATVFFNMNFETWSVEGQYRSVTTANGFRVGYLEVAGEPVSFTFPGETGTKDQFLSIFTFVPQEGQQMTMYRVYFGLKWPNTGVYIHFFTR